MSYKFFIKGVVQGVGFRPYIYQACQKACIKGYVQNTEDGVVIAADNRDDKNSVKPTDRKVNKQADLFATLANPSFFIQVLDKLPAILSPMIINILRQNSEFETIVLTTKILKSVAYTGRGRDLDMLIPNFHKKLIFIPD